ncbi:hypothetical protein K3495_g3788 [Podosphaera aphanis]|nr:hypothetical protein K3495_g3788 [Podosphaera aphanis]
MATWGSYLSSMLKKSDNPSVESEKSEINPISETSQNAPKINEPISVEAGIGGSKKLSDVNSVEANTEQSVQKTTPNSARVAKLFGYSTTTKTSASTTLSAVENSTTQVKPTSPVIPSTSINSSVSANSSVPIISSTTETLSNPVDPSTSRVAKLFGYTGAVEQSASVTLLTPEKNNPEILSTTENSLPLAGTSKNEISPAQANASASRVAKLFGFTSPVDQSTRNIPKTPEKSIPANPSTIESSLPPAVLSIAPPTSENSPAPPAPPAPATSRVAKLFGFSGAADKVASDIQLTPEESSPVNPPSIESSPPPKPPESSPLPVTSSNTPSATEKPPAAATSRVAKLFGFTGAADKATPDIQSTQERSTPVNPPSIESSSPPKPPDSSPLPATSSKISPTVEKPPAVATSRVAKLFGFSGAADKVASDIQSTPEESSPVNPPSIESSPPPKPPESSPLPVTSSNTPSATEKPPVAATSRVAKLFGFTGAADKATPDIQSTQERSTPVNPPSIESSSPPKPPDSSPLPATSSKISPTVEKPPAVSTSRVDKLFEFTGAIDQSASNIQSTPEKTVPVELLSKESSPPSANVLTTKVNLFEYRKRTESSSAQINISAQSSSPISLASSTPVKLLNSETPVSSEITSLSTRIPAPVTPVSSRNLLSQATRVSQNFNVDQDPVLNSLEALSSSSNTRTLETRSNFTNKVSPSLPSPSRRPNQVSEESMSQNGGNSNTYKSSQVSSLDVSPSSIAGPSKISILIENARNARKNTVKPQYPRPESSSSFSSIGSNRSSIFSSSTSRQSLVESRNSSISLGLPESIRSDLKEQEARERRLQAEKETRDKIEAYMRSIEQMRIERDDMERERLRMLDEEQAFERDESRFKEEEEQMRIFMEDVQRSRAREEAEALERERIRRELEEQERKQREEEQRLREEQERKQREEEQRLREEQERKQREEEQRLRDEQERKQREEEQRLREEQERYQREEERKARVEQEKILREEEQKARDEKKRRARDEEERKIKEEQERKMREEKERKEREDQDEITLMQAELNKRVMASEKELEERQKELSEEKFSEEKNLTKMVEKQNRNVIPNDQEFQPRNTYLAAVDDERQRFEENDKYSIYDEYYPDEPVKNNTVNRDQFEEEQIARQRSEQKNRQLQEEAERRRYVEEQAARYRNEEPTGLQINSPRLEQRPDQPRMVPQTPRLGPPRMGPQQMGPQSPRMGPPRVGPQQMGPQSRRLGPPQMGPQTRRLGPPQMGPPQMGPPQMGPPRMGPPRMGPPRMGPQSPRMGPPRMGPQSPRMSPPRMGPQSPRMGPPRMGPQQMGPPRMGPPQRMSPQQFGTQSGRAGPSQMDSLRTGLPQREPQRMGPQQFGNQTPRSVPSKTNPPQEDQQRQQENEDEDSDDEEILDPQRKKEKDIKKAEEKMRQAFAAMASEKAQASTATSNVEESSIPRSVISRNTSQRSEQLPSRPKLANSGLPSGPKSRRQNT